MGVTRSKMTKKFIRCYLTEKNSSVLTLLVNKFNLMNLLGENGYFIRLGHFRQKFKLLWHAPKRTLCLQNCWILFIYYVVRLQQLTCLWEVPKAKKQVIISRKQPVLNTGVKSQKSHVNRCQNNMFCIVLFSQMYSQYFGKTTCYLY